MSAFRKWHRYLGLAAVMFVILLTLTGLALNHTEQLKLDSHRVKNPKLLDWYGIHGPDTLVSFRAGQAILTEVNDQVYWGSKHHREIGVPLVGALEYGGLILVATKERLNIFTKAGELVEQLDGFAGAPRVINKIGITPQGLLAVASDTGGFLSNEDLLTWAPGDVTTAHWSQSSPTSFELVKVLRAAYRGNGLSLERVLLDLHSGRMFGKGGVYLVDAAAIILLLLAFSGAWMWLKRGKGGGVKC